MSGVAVVLGSGRVISESETLPRALHVDAWGAGTVLVTIEDTETGYPMGQMTLTGTEIAEIGAIALELAELGVIPAERD